MNKSGRMQMQAIVVLLGIIFLLILVVAGLLWGKNKNEQPKGTYMNIQDVEILTEAAGILHADASDANDYVTFETVLADFGGITQLQKPLAELEKRYESEHYILKEDWYLLFDSYLETVGLSGNINRIEIVSLGAGEQLTDAAGNSMPKNVLITEEKEFAFVSPDFYNYRFIPVSAYQKDGTLLTVFEPIEEDYVISNAWIMEIAEAYLLFFWNDYEIRIDYNNSGVAEDTNATETTLVSENAREQVADISFFNGVISEVNPKLEKVNGKILSLDETSITVEGIGTLPFSSKLKIYQIYDKLVRKYTGDLRIGYNFADFVIVDGQVEACLITRDEAMENIRVLINNSNYAGRYHQFVKATSDTDFIVRYGTYDDLQEQAFKAGDVVEFGMDSAYFMGDRIMIVPKALTGKVELLSVERSQGNPMYRGNIEILKTAEGLAVINEVLLEEYLYCVVPSEMPASYPLEALKAQAVCARTYAYRKMMNSGLPAFGAHLDDSTSFQVYNNIKENVETTKAVRETKGQLLYSNETLVDAYYYSTSCGFGTTADIWKSGSPSPEYLQAKRIGSIGVDNNINEETMMNEDVFSSYIQTAYESDYDSSEGWYRWNYMVGELDATVIAERMQARQKANKNLILKHSQNDEYVTNEVESFDVIFNITCGQRLPGGVLDSLFIETDKGTYKVIGEYNIRYVLNDGKAKVCKQGGSEVASPTLLPSAFFVMDVQMKGECVSGYAITGGGYGHGVGMSQNGAKNMALEGMDSTQILTFYYDGSTVKAVY